MTFQDIISFIDEYYALIFGVSLLAAGCYQGVRYDYLRRRGKRTVGIIADYVSDHDDDGESPVIKFKTLERGEIYTKKIDYSSTFRFYDLGQKVTVIYDPENPKRASVDSKILHIWIPLAVMVVGAGFIIYGITLM